MDEIDTRGLADGSTSRPDTFTYRAFISYSHRDQAWARWLLARLEGYSVPQGIATQSGEVPPRRLGRFFRDRDDASAAGDLGAEIRKALSESQNLIVVASPASARSRYVDQEIREFAALNGTRPKPGRILTLIVAGEPNVSGGAEPDPRECFPPALRGGLVGPDGKVLEPLAADARSVGDGKTRAIAKLVSGLLDIRYDSLVRRDLQRRRRNRMVAAAAGIAALAAVGGALWQIESDRREKERLAELQSQTDRDRRTLAAVNTSIRARDLLTAGRRESAVQLAREALVTDGSIPFIPQAYSVLYEAGFIGSRPREFDIIAYGQLGLNATPLADGTYFSVDQLANAVIWSPTEGVIHQRKTGGADLRGLTSDGSTVFVDSWLGMLRYTVATRTWDEFSYSGLSMDNLKPVIQVALGPDSIVGCTRNQLIGIALPPQGGGEATMAWQASLGDSACASLAVAPTGELLIGMWNGDIVRFDLGTRTETGRLSTGRNEWVSFLYFGGDLLETYDGEGTNVFRLSDGQTLLSFDAPSFTTTLSPDGSRAVELVYSADTQISFVIHDLAARTQTPVRCECAFQGFDAAGNILVLTFGQAAAVLDGRTGAALRQLHQFDRDVDDLALIDGGATLVAYRQSGPETIVPLQASSNVLLQAADQAGVSLASAQFLSDTDIATVFVHPKDGLLKRYDAIVMRRQPDGTMARIWGKEDFGGGPYGHGGMIDLGQGLVGLLKSETIMSYPARLGVARAENGDEVYATAIDSPPGVNASRTAAVLEGKQKLLVFDLAKKVEQALDLEAFEFSIARNWALSGDRLIVSSGRTLQLFDTGSGAAVPAATYEMGGWVHHVCVADDGATAYVLGEGGSTEADAHLFVSRRSLADGAETDRIVYSADSGAELEILLFYVAQDPRIRSEGIRCAAGHFAANGYENDALLWRPGGGTPAIVPLTEVPSPVLADARPLPDSDVIPTETLADARLVRDDRAVMLLDGTTGAVLRRLPQEASASRIVSATYLPEAGWLAAGFENGDLRVWDARTPGAPTIALKAHGGSVDYLESNPSGTEIMSGDRSGALLRWPVLGVGDLLARFPDAR
ncbi:MAG: TIR domain-containing protein [Rhizobiaceae bacterium]|nr:TIR domain-containing protein [Rhizobiaceae bacterium]